MSHARIGRLLGIAMLSFLMLAGCTTTGNHRPLEVVHMAPPDPTVAVVSEVPSTAPMGESPSALSPADLSVLEPQGEDYLLRNGDTLTVRFLHNPELNVDAPVRPDGKITLPLVGDLAVQGKPLHQVQSQIVEAYRGFIQQTGYGDFLKEGDFFDLRFVYNPELNIGVRVRSDGKVSLPILGDIQAAGIRPEEFRKTLLREYARHIKQPDVALLVAEQTARKIYAEESLITVAVAQHSDQRIFVGGEVHRPGTVSFNGRFTSLQAIMQAGGVKETGDLGKVVVLRRGEFEDTIWIRTDLSQPLSGRSIQNDVVLRSGDVLVVPLSGIAKVDLFVKQYIREVLPVQSMFNINVAPLGSGN